MKVRKSTFERDLLEKEAAFLKLTGVERLKLMRAVSERLRKPGVNYQVEGTEVRIRRKV
jgi:hypothetical protein